jgi:hypothetical protein
VGRPGSFGRARSWRAIPSLLVFSALLLGGCGLLTPVNMPGPGPTPVVAMSSFVPTEPPEVSPPTTGTATAVPPPIVEPSARPSGSDLCTVPSSPTSLFCVTKNSEGAHGGAPILDLPNAIAMDYWVRGTCIFRLGLSTLQSAAGLPSLTMTVSGPEVDGTWRALVKPGRYYPVIGEAVGCVYSVNVREDR